MPTHAEHRGDIDVHHSRCFVGVEVFESAARAGDPGIVDEDVDATQPIEGLGHEPVDLGGRPDVGHPTAALIVGLDGGHRVGVDVTEGRPGAGFDDRVDDRPTDAGRAGGDDHAQAGEIEFERHGPDVRRR